MRTAAIAGRAVEAGAAAGAACGALAGLPFLYLIFPPVIGALVGVLVGELIGLLSVPLLVVAAKAGLTPTAVGVSAAAFCGLIAVGGPFALGGTAVFTAESPYPPFFLVLTAGLAAAAGGCSASYAAYGPERG